MDQGRKRKIAPRAFRLLKSRINKVPAIPLESSAAAWVRYEATLNVLEVKYLEGDRYWYFGVPKRIYSQLICSDSKGHYLNTEVKPTYPYLQVPVGAF